MTTGKSWRRLLNAKTAIWVIWRHGSWNGVSICYSKLGVSLVELKDTKVVRDKVLRKRAEHRLMLREEAHSPHERTLSARPRRENGRKVTQSISEARDVF